MKKIMIIWLEGNYKDVLKQEKELFHQSKSKRIWDRFFEKINFKNHIFRPLPQNLNSIASKRQKAYYKFLENKIDVLLKGQYNKYQNENIEYQNIKLHFLITGDHDEKNKQTLNKRETTANLIKVKIEKIVSPEIKFEVAIILEKKSSFKIEGLMQELIGSKEKINKKFLRKTLGTEYPNLDELFKILPKKLEINQKVKILEENFEKSSHPIMKKIWEWS